MDYRPILQEHPLLKNVQFSIVHRAPTFGPNDENLEGSHIHHCHEIYVNLSGDISFLVNNQVYPIQTGDIILTRPGDIHVCIYNKTCVHDHYCIWLAANDSSPLLEYFQTQNFQPFLSPSATQKATILDLLRYMTTEAKNSMEKTGVLLQLLTLIFENDTPPTVPLQATVPEALQNVLNFIDEKYAEIQHIKELYATHYLSPATLNRWFKTYLQISPREYLLAKKLVAAKRLLDTGASVTDACMKTGFTDCSHFISLFKKKFGQTPFRYKSSQTTTI